MRVERVAVAGGAFGRDANSVVADAACEEALADRLGKIDGLLPAGMGPPERWIEGARDLGADRETARVDAGTDHGVEASGTSFRSEALDGAGGDAGLGASPTGVKEGAVTPLRVDDGDRRAIGGRDGHPRIARLDEETIGFGPCFA